MKTKGYLATCLIYSLSLLFHPFPTHSAEKPLGWKNAGLYGGQIFTIAVDPHNPAVVFAGSYYGDGLFKSVDGGETWQSVDGFRNEAVLLVAFSPSNPTVIWVAGAAGIYKSTDGGTNWVTFDPATTSEFYRLYYCIAVDPTNENTVYVGTSGLFGDNDGGTVFRTADGGQTWGETSLTADHNVWSIAVNPRNPLEVWAVTGPEWVSEGSIYRSRDGGDTWTQVQTSLNQGWLDEVVINPTNPAVVLVTGEKGVIRATNGGISWTHLEPDKTCGALVFDPGNFSGMYAAFYKQETGEGVMAYSLDEGNTWTTNPIGNLRFLSLAVSPQNREVIYGGDASLGVYRSGDGGIHWETRNQGIQASHVFDSLETATGLLIAGSQSGVYIADQTGVWNKILDSPCQTLALAPSLENVIYAGLDWRFGRTTDLGQTWSFTSIPSADPNTVSAIAVDPYESDLLYVGVAYRSGDRGEIYRSADGGITITSSATFDVPVNAMIIDPSDPRVIYAGTGSFYASALPGALYRSADEGRTWSRLALPEKVVNTLAFDEQDPQVIYVGCGDSGGGFNGLFKSTDGGITWSEIDFGIPGDAAIVDIELDREESNLIYAATHRHGIYVSDSGGDYWMLLGLPDYWIYSILLSRDGLRGRQNTSQHQVLASSLYVGTGAGLMEFTGQGIGMISGFIADAETGLSMTGATIATNTGGIALSLEGYYCLLAPSGTCTVQAYAEGYDFSSAFGVPVIAGEEAPADLILKPLADINITKVELQSAEGFRVSSPITIKADVMSQGTPYYQYWVSPGYGVSTPENWTLLQSYTANNSLIWSPPAEDRYMIVVWVTDDPDLHAPQMGGISVTVGDDADARIENIVANASIFSSAQTEVVLTTSLAEQTTSHYYQYWVGDNYGYPPEMQIWEPITDYSRDNHGVWTPPVSGYYTTLVEVNADTGNSTPEIAGMTWVIH